MCLMMRSCVKGLWGNVSDGVAELCWFLKMM